MIKMAKKGLFLGLLIAGAGIAYSKYRSLDEDGQRAVREDILDKADIVRDRAVDYAFYANDVLDDLKDAWNDHKANSSDTETYSDEEDTEENDDIVLSSDDLIQDQTGNDDEGTETVTFNPNTDK